MARLLLEFTDTVWLQVLCSAHYFYRLDGLLELGRALRRQIGYRNVPDTLRCGAACSRLPVTLDACPLLLARAPLDRLFSPTPWRNVLLQGHHAAANVHVDPVPSLPVVLAALEPPVAAALTAAFLAYVEPVAHFTWPDDAATVAAMLR